MAQRHRMPCQAEEINIQNIVYVNYSVIMIAIMAGHYIILLMILTVITPLVPLCWTHTRP